MTLTVPLYSVQAAFGFAPFAASPTWTDITAWVQSGSTKRGRQHELQRFEAGTMTLTLNNRDGRFSQWNTNSPYSGNLVPGTPVKVTATWPRVGGTTYPVFYGFVDSWTPAYGGVMKNEMTISATDGMKLLSLANLDTGAYSKQVVTDGAAQFYKLADAIGTVAFADSSGNNLTGTAVGGFLFGADGFQLTDAATTVANNGWGYGVVPGYAYGSAYTIEAWVKSTYTAANQIVAELGGAAALGIYGATGFVDFTAGGGFTGLTGTTDVLDGNWHHIVGVANGTTATLYVDGAQQATATITASTPSGVSYLAGGNILGSVALTLIGGLADVAGYNSALTAAQVATHYQLGTAGFATPQYSGQRIAAMLATYGWPSGMQNIATGVSQVQAATGSLTQTSALSYIQTVEATEQGFFYVDESGNLTFRDRHYVVTATAANTSQGYFDAGNTGNFHYLIGSIIPAADDLDLWTDVVASRQNGIPQQASNLTSATKYAWRSLTGFTGMLQETDAEVLSLAQWQLAHYSTPISRVRQMSLDGVSGAGANFPQMLGRALLDQVTVDWLPLDSSTVHFIQPSLIESIEHDFSQDSWKTTWGLSPAETQNYLILDNATLGKLDNARLGY